MILRREGQLAPLTLDEMDTNKALEIMACLAGEAAAKRIIREAAE